MCLCLALVASDKISSIGSQARPSVPLKQIPERPRPYISEVSYTTAPAFITVSVNVGTRSHLQASFPLNSDHDKLTILTRVHGCKVSRILDTSGY